MRLRWAAVLAHELAHIVLHQSDRGEYLSELALPFSDLEIFSHLDFHFEPEQELEADRKGLELFAKSPYKDQMAKAGLFLAVLEARSAQLPNLLRGRFSNDFGSSHLTGMQGLSRSGQLQTNRLDQVGALPLGSRIGVNPWSDQIELLKSKPVQLGILSRENALRGDSVFLPSEASGGWAQDAERYALNETAALALVPRELRLSTHRSDLKRAGRAGLIDGPVRDSSLAVFDGIRSCLKAARASAATVIVQTRKNKELASNKNESRIRIDSCGARPRPRADRLCSPGLAESHRQFIAPAELPAAGSCVAACGLRAWPRSASTAIADRE